MGAAERRPARLAFLHGFAIGFVATLGLGLGAALYSSPGPGDGLAWGVLLTAWPLLTVFAFASEWDTWLLLLLGPVLWGVLGGAAGVLVWQLRGWILRRRAQKRNALDPFRQRVRTAGHAVAVWALVSWPVSFLLFAWCAIMSPDSWVGAGHLPIPWFVFPVVVAPAVIGGLSGIGVLVLGVISRSWLAVAEGLFAVASGVVLFVFSGGMVALAHIS